MKFLKELRGWVLGILVALVIALIILAVAVEFGQVSSGYLEIFSIKTPLHLSSLPPFLMKTIRFIIAVFAEIFRWLGMLLNKF